MELPQENQVSHPLLADEFQQLKREYESNPSVQSKFNYAWALIRSNVKAEQRQGLSLLQGILL
jgi:fission 1 protein